MQELFDKDLSTNAVARLVLAGARAVALATQAQLYTQLRERDQRADDALRVLATQVLADWGVHPPTLTEAPAPVAKPDEDEPELLWPPRSPELPVGYDEIYYHVREDCLGASRDSRDEPTNLTPAMELLFTGASEWDKADNCWLLRMGLLREGALIPGMRPSLGQLRTFWLRSRDIKPGSDIPKGPL